MPICPYCHSDTPNGVQCKSCGAALSQRPQTRSIKVLPRGKTLAGGRFVIKSVIGAGMFGVTYKALHKASLEMVAVKEHHPRDLVERHEHDLVAVPGQERAFDDSIARFLREAQRLAALRHQNVVEYHELFREHGTAFLVMEYLEGETLEARLLRSTLNNNEWVRAVQQLLGALACIHEAGLLHRDIKPANILLCAGRTKLVDFGAATDLQTQATSRILTPAYAALEQYGQRIGLGPASDLYALAATMLEAITGHAPPSALERANGTAFAPRCPMGVDARVFRAVVQALSLRIADRPQSAHFMLSLCGLKVEAPSYGPDSGAV